MTARIFQLAAARPREAGNRPHTSPPVGSVRPIPTRHLRLVEPGYSVRWQQRIAERERVARGLRTGLLVDLLLWAVIGGCFWLIASGTL